MALIETRGLSKIYTLGKNRQVVALNNVTIGIEEGEIFGILGPNGSGKTTCLKLLLGIIFPTEGEIEIMGENQYSVTAKKNIGFLPENPYYYDYLTGPEILMFYGKLFDIPVSVISSRTEELLHLVGLYDARNLALKHYSKGMLERIGLAASLINDPKILILDEPTTGLDPIGCKETRDLLIKLNQAGKTILLSSHFLSEVERVCTRIAIFHRGYLLSSGTLDGLMKDYQAENLEDLFVKTIEKFDTQEKQEVA
ncbi:MAG: ABC transporter ATP-binding protein [Candidatus Omnitrophica bacterium]|nr:ABC transporter ATP-binding protein [Candidatus Omnitrophota bacterium]MCM8776946.1 ABC transporter ATP-binding protein [Candidatus Omnitrophota bacterium]